MVSWKETILLYKPIFLVHFTRRPVYFKHNPAKQFCQLPGAQKHVWMSSKRIQKKKRTKRNKTPILISLYVHAFNFHPQQTSQSPRSSHVDTVNVIKHVTKQGNMNSAGLKCTYSWQTEWKGQLSWLHYRLWCAWSMKGESFSVNTKPVFPTVMWSRVRSTFSLCSPGQWSTSDW